MVDFATAASQNGFSTYKLSLYKKTKVIQKLTKKHNIFFYFPFYRIAVVNKITFVEFCKHPFVMQPLQNPQDTYSPTCYPSFPKQDFT
jgi:hypothetical protein